MPVRGYYRVVAGDMAPMCSWCKHVSVDSTMVGHIDSIWLGL